MIRRDYLLRMIEQCVQALKRSLVLLEERRSAEAEVVVDEAVRNLIGLDMRQVTQQSEAQLLAFLLQGEASQFLRQKGLLLVSLLHRAGQLHAAGGRWDESKACFIKSLNLLLELLLREGPFEFPEFVPRIEVLAAAVPQGELPMATQMAFVHFYEVSGQFAKAEDALFELAQNSSRPGLLEFGVQFYERLLRRPDQVLEEGNLPRAEVEAGFIEWKRQPRAH